MVEGYQGGTAGQRLQQHHCGRLGTGLAGGEGEEGGGAPSLAAVLGKLAAGEQHRVVARRLARGGVRHEHTTSSAAYEDGVEGGALGGA